MAAAVDNWAFQKAGATEREAAARAVGPGLLEYVVLSIGAVFASAALFFRLGRTRERLDDFADLLIVPCLVLGFHLTSPHLTSPHLTSPHLTSPHLTSPHLTEARETFE